MVKLEYKIGDCLELIKDIPDKSINLVVMDPQTVVLKLERIEPGAEMPELPTMEEVQKEIEEYARWKNHLALAAKHSKNAPRDFFKRMKGAATCLK